jgi:hypothetical protein
MPVAGTGPTVRASALAVAVLYVLPFAVLWWFGPLAWVGLVPESRLSVRDAQ